MDNQDKAIFNSTIQEILHGSSTLITPDKIRSSLRRAIRLSDTPSISLLLANSSDTTLENIKEQVFIIPTIAEHTITQQLIENNIYEQRIQTILQAFQTLEIISTKSSEEEKQNSLYTAIIWAMFPKEVMTLMQGFFPRRNAEFLKRQCSLPDELLVTIAAHTILPLLEKPALLHKFPRCDRTIETLEYAVTQLSKLYATGQLKRISPKEERAMLEETGNTSDVPFRPRMM